MFQQLVEIEAIESILLILVHLSGSTVLQVDGHVIFLERLCYLKSELNSKTLNIFNVKEEEKKDNASIYFSVHYIVKIDRCFRCSSCRFTCCISSLTRISTTEIR